MNRRTVFLAGAAAAAGIPAASLAAPQGAGTLGHYFPEGSPQKKKIGLIGGTGPESTLDYYRLLEYGTQKRFGKNFYPSIAIESVSVYDIFRFSEAKDYKGLANYLTEAVKRLAGAGCDVATFTGVTPHVVFEEVEAKSPIPMLSVITPTVDYAQARGMKKLALIATQFTMTGAFFSRPFERAGIELVKPNAQEIAFIGHKLDTEIEAGKYLPETQEAFRKIIARLAGEKPQALILGCTEMPGFLKGVDLPLPAVDPMALHIERLIDLILKG